jgi:hypothetical protein
MLDIQLTEGGGQRGGLLCRGREKEPEPRSREAGLSFPTAGKPKVMGETV